MTQEEQPKPRKQFHASAITISQSNTKKSMSLRINFKSKTLNTTIVMTNHSHI